MLNSKALGYTFGVLVGGLWLVIMGFSLVTGVGQVTVSTLGGFHPWFSYSWGGLVTIVIEHLIGGFVLGWLFGWLYNKFAA